MDALDVVRRVYAAANEGDLDRVLSWYADDVLVDVAQGDGLSRGIHAAREAWAGPLSGRYEVRRVAGVETGWGWVRADWDHGERRGYAYFWIEDNRIRRHRHVYAPPAAAKLHLPPLAATSRHLPPPAAPRRPVFGVGGVVFDAEGRVLIVRRKHEPLAGQWSLPGGRLEIGETLEAATAREMAEETGLLVDVGPLVEVFDRILLDADGQVQHHFVIADYLCTVRGGRLAAGSDVTDVRWVSEAEVPQWVATEKARDVIARARALRSAPGPLL